MKVVASVAGAVDHDDNTGSSSGGGSSGRASLSWNFLYLILLSLYLSVVGYGISTDICRGWKVISWINPSYLLSHSITQAGGVNWLCHIRSCISCMSM